MKKKIIFLFSLMVSSTWAVSPADWKTLKEIIDNYKAIIELDDISYNSIFFNISEEISPILVNDPKLYRKWNQMTQSQKPATKQEISSLLEKFSEAMDQAKIPQAAPILEKSDQKPNLAYPEFAKSVQDIMETIKTQIENEKTKIFEKIFTLHPDAKTVNNEYQLLPPVKGINATRNATAAPGVTTIYDVLKVAYETEKSAQQGISDLFETKKTIVNDGKDLNVENNVLDPITIAIKKLHNEKAKAHLLSIWPLSLEACKLIPDDEKDLPKLKETTLMHIERFITYVNYYMHTGAAYEKEGAEPFYKLDKDVREQLQELTWGLEKSIQSLAAHTASAVENLMDKLSFWLSHNLKEEWKNGKYDSIEPGKDHLSQCSDKCPDDPDENFKCGKPDYITGKACKHILLAVPLEKRIEKLLKYGEQFIKEEPSKENKKGPIKKPSLSISEAILNVMDLYRSHGSREDSFGELLQEDHDKMMKALCADDVLTRVAVDKFKALTRDTEDKFNEILSVLSSTNPKIRDLIKPYKELDPLQKCQALLEARSGEGNTVYDLLSVIEKQGKYWHEANSLELGIMFSDDTLWTRTGMINALTSAINKIPDVKLKNHLLQVWSYANLNNLGRDPLECPPLVRMKEYLTWYVTTDKYKSEDERPYLLSHETREKLFELSSELEEVHRKEGKKIESKIESFLEENEKVFPLTMLLKATWQACETDCIKPDNPLDEGCLEHPCGHHERKLTGKNRCDATIRAMKKAISSLNISGYE